MSATITGMKCLFLLSLVPIFIQIGWKKHSQEIQLVSYITGKNLFGNQIPPHENVCVN